jgi:hypothetical protein
MACVANAAWYWEGDVSNDWSNADNWNDGTVSPPGTIPHSPTESMRIPTGTVSADISDTMGYIMLSRSADGTGVGNADLTLGTPGVMLNVSTGSSELVSVAYSDNVTNNLNVSAGRLNVFRGNNAGELRLNHVYAGTCVGNLNLSGTGIVDVEVLNKGDRLGGGNFTGTGGTLIVRDEIDKFGLVDQDPSYGFFLGGTTLEIADWSNRLNPVGYIEIGNSQDTDFFMSDDSAVVFDLGDASGAGGTDWDLIVSEGNYVVDGTLLVNYLVAPNVGDYWDVWTILAGDEGNYDGSGVFDSLPANIVTSWVDVGTGTDTLRLTYIPEPATIVLLGLGMFAMRRRKQ